MRKGNLRKGLLLCKLNRLKFETLLPALTFSSDCQLSHLTFTGTVFCSLAQLCNMSNNYLGHAGVQQTFMNYLKENHSIWEKKWIIDMHQSKNPYWPWKPGSYSDAAITRLKWNHHKICLDGFVPVIATLVQFTSQDWYSFYFSLLPPRLFEPLQKSVKFRLIWSWSLLKPTPRAPEQNCQLSVSTESSLKMDNYFHVLMDKFDL